MVIMLEIKDSLLKARRRFFIVTAASFVSALLIVFGMSIRYSVNDVCLHEDKANDFLFDVYVNYECYEDDNYFLLHITYRGTSYSDLYGTDGPARFRDMSSIQIERPDNIKGIGIVSVKYVDSPDIMEKYGFKEGFHYDFYNKKSRASWDNFKPEILYLENGEELLIYKKGRRVYMHILQE